MLTQFIRAQGPQPLLVISWIFRLKNVCFVFLTIFLNCFQSSIHFEDLYFLRSLLQFKSHQLLEHLVILTVFKYWAHKLSVVWTMVWTEFLSEMISVLWQPLDQYLIAALTSKSQRWISSGKHELCNSQENLIKNYNNILPTIYMKSLWFMLRLCLYCASYPKVHVSSMSAPCVHHVVAMIYPHVYYSSTSKPTCHIHVPWCHLLDHRSFQTTIGPMM